MKRFLFLFFASLLAVATWAYDFSDSSTGTTFYYNYVAVDDEGTGVEVTYETTAYNSYAGAISIPQTATDGTNEYSVVGIGNYAFNSCTAMTSISIPNTVTSIGQYALQGCEGLTTLSIPSSITSMGTQACIGCTNLKELRLEDGTETLAMTTASTNNVFTKCPIETLYLGRVLSSSQKAYAVFRDMTTLTSLTMSESLPAFCDYEFYGCTGLTGKLEIPSSITETATYVFYKCSNITEVSFPAAFTTIGEYTFAYTGLKEINIPSSITTIGNNAFRYCDGLTVATIPSTVSSLGTYVFGNCTSLVSAKVEEGVSDINTGLFYQCTKLEEVSLPTTATSIGAYVFSGCTALKTITIPSGVTSIGNYAFQTCETLAEVNFSEGLETLGNYVFSKCYALSKVELPEGLTSIGTYAFQTCSGLVSVSIPTTITSLPNYCFDACSSLEEVKLPETLTSTGTYVFRDCTALKEISIPESVTTIGNYAFYRCTGLEHFFEYNATPPSVGSATFNGASTSTCYLVVPTGSKSTYASKSYWKNFTNIIEFTPSFDDLEVEDITECSAVISANYTAGYYETIEKGFEYWATEGDVQQVVVEGDDMKIEVTDLAPSTTYTYRAYAKTADDTYYSESGTFTTWDAVLLEEGEKFEKDGIYYSCVSPESLTIEVTWGGEKNSSGTDTYVGSITIPEQVTYQGYTYTVVGIGDSAFRNCKTLTGIILPSTLTYIASSYAFYATAIESIAIPETVTEIGDYAFYNCTALTAVSLPAGLTALSKYTFGGCEKLTGLAALPDGITSIGDYCFNSCAALTELTLPSALVTVGGSAFNGCSALTTLSFPNTVESLGTYACQKCYALETVTLGENLATIGNYAFKDCTSLTAIALPTTVASTLGTEVFNGCTALATVSLGNVTSIGNKAFYGCTALEEITFPDALASLGTEVFSGCTGIKKVDTGNGLTAISNKTFYNCQNLAEVTIGTSVASIGQYAFYHCDGLKELVIPDNVTSLDQYVCQYCVGLEKVSFGAGLTALPIEGFRGCSSLTEAPIPANITSIGNTTFKECSALKEFVIPDNVTSIGTYVFMSCTALKSISLGSGLTAISQGAFNYCSELKEVVIPEGVTSIASSAFYGCTNLVSVNIPDGVTSITASSFRDCESLPAITIPKSVTEIANYAFNGCAALTTVTIPAQVTKVGKEAFGGCEKLVAVYSLSDTPPTCDTSSSTCAFSEETLAGTLYVPVAAGEAYAEATTWQDFYKIVEMVEFAIETLAPTDITDTTATLHGTVTEGYDDPISERGFEYWAYKGEVQTVAIDDAADGEFSLALTDLPYGTDYTYRVYVVAESGTIYGDEVYFTTDLYAPAIETLDATDVAETSAVLNGTVAQGSEPITSKGFVYWESNPNQITTIIISDEDDAMTYTLEGLTPATTYTYRAFAVTATGTTYGDDVAFTTGTEVVSPTVLTYEATDITATTALIKGYVEAGTEEITKQGFEYWTEDGDTESITSDDNVMALILSDLTPETTYTYHAYAVTASGTTYGDDVAFTTLEDTSTGISRLSSDDANIEGIYSTDGQKRDVALRGINIVRYTDGTVKKIYVK